MSVKADTGNSSQSGRSASYHFVALMGQNGILEELLLAVDAPPETQLKVAGEDLLRQRLSAVYEEVTEMPIQ